MEMCAIHTCRDTGILFVLLLLLTIEIPAVVRKQSSVSMPSYLMRGLLSMGKNAISGIIFSPIPL
jgi:hypothetical protein